MDNSYALQVFLNGKATATEDIDNSSYWGGFELALQLLYRAYELGYSAFAS